MADPADGYDSFYAEKLWALVPAVYRAEDSITLDGRGPLRELIERIGAQAAVLRRSIDRLWADQSIETCDDWVIPYLGDLLATNLVASLDARGQRLDVAKTIYYRRRKGTLGLLEELASDITGWSARVVEMFRLLARARHLLDPPLGDPASAPDPTAARALLAAERIVGARTGSPAGGMADLRRVLGASRTGTAFDEYAHTADVRRGVGATGWHGIPRLGVFLWRLESLPVTQGTPVQDRACPNQYTFDPTGRDAPLFAAATGSVGDAWVSPREPQVPGPIDALLFDAERDTLYAAPDVADPTVVAPNSIGLYRAVATATDLVAPARVGADPQLATSTYLVEPARGRLLLRGDALTDNGALRVSFCYGFPSTIGAGPYDRRRRGTAAVATPAPIVEVTGGGGALVAALAAAPATGTVSVDDFLTYDGAADPAAALDLTVRAANRRRAVVRFPAGAAPWTFTGAGATARLALEGLLVTSGEIVLRGTFAEVTISCCTLDPGERAPVGWRAAADGRPLVPCRLRVQGHVQSLVIDRSVVASIVEERAAGGRIETLTVTDSVVQAAGPAPALVLPSGAAELTRTTVLGVARVHRLHASECILHDQATVDDVQHGCVRFSAWATGSVLPGPYESVEIAPRATLFTSTRFGQPGYGQLLASVESAIALGAEDGSEMGAYCRDKNPIKVRSLLIKYREYMPVGLEPVTVFVT